jgi:hypothetical protein
MQIEFLQTSQPGLRWMIQYYRSNPQLSEAKAFASFAATERRIAELAPPRETFADLKDVWEVKIQKTAFSFLYTIQGQTVYVIDIRDQRGHRSAEALRAFDRELRQRYDD